MSAHSSESHVGFYEQKLADLQVELKRLKLIVDKGRPLSQRILWIGKKATISIKN